MKLIQNNEPAERLRFKHTAKEGESPSRFYEKILISSNTWVRGIKEDSRRLVGGGGLSHHGEDGTMTRRDAV